MITPPWNASWSAERRFEVRTCRWAGGIPAMWQPHAPGEGEPIFAMPHFVRQRRAVAQMLCTVCGEPTLGEQRWMFPFGVWREIKGKTMWLTTETPVHRRCADHAMNVCPHIRNRLAVPVPFPLGGWRVIASYVGGPEVEKDFGLTIPPTQRVVGALKLHLPDSWARKHAGPPPAPEARKLLSSDIRS